MGFNYVTLMKVQPRFEFKSCHILHRRGRNLSRMALGSCWFAYCSRHEHFGHVRFVSWDLSVRIESVASLDWYLFYRYASYIFICIHITICFCLCFSRLLLTLPRLVCPRPYASSCWSTNGRGSEIERKTGRKLTGRSGAASLIPPSWSNRSWMWIEKCWTSSLPPTTKQVRVCLTVVQSSFYSSGSVQRRAADAPMTLRARLLWVVTLAVSTGILGGGLEPGEWWCAHHLHQDLLIPGAGTATNIMYSLGRSQVSPISVPHG